MNIPSEKIMSPQAREVFLLADKEATRLIHNFVGTEHILLALLRARGAKVAKILDRMKVTPQMIRKDVESLIEPGVPSVSGEKNLTPLSKKVIELSIDEARHLNHHYLGPEHLFLGLIREGEGIAGTVLANLGVTLQKVRAEIRRDTPLAPKAAPRRTLGVDDFKNLLAAISSITPGELALISQGKETLETVLGGSIELRYPGLWPLVLERPYLANIAHVCVYGLIQLDEELAPQTKTRRKRTTP